MDFEARRQLRAELVTAQWVSEELELSVTRQARTTAPQEGKSSETPLMFNDKASEAAVLLHDTLLDWAIPGHYTSTAQIAEAMILNIMAYEDEGVLEEVRYAVSVAMKAIDTQPVSIYLGDCVCGSRLYGDPDADALECNLCALVHKPKVLRLANQRRGYDLKVTAAQAGQYLGEVYGIPVNVNRIRIWSSRKKITPVWTEPNGTNVFRLGDIIECARRMNQQ